MANLLHKYLKLCSFSVIFGVFKTSFFFQQMNSSLNKVFNWISKFLNNFLFHIHIFRIFFFKFKRCLVILCLLLFSNNTTIEFLKKKTIKINLCFLFSVVLFCCYIKKKLIQSVLKKKILIKNPDKKIFWWNI